MTFEQAAYFRLLLLCGYTNELEAFIDTALEEQNPIPDIILALSFCRSDINKSITALTEYIEKADPAKIDDDTVFQYIHSFLRSKFVEEQMSPDMLAELMYAIAICTDKYLDEPWYSLYMLGDCYEEAKMGYYDTNGFMQNFYGFLQDSDFSLTNRSPTVPKKSKLKEWFHSVFKRVRP